MAIDLAKLQVALEANSAQFTREMEKVNSRLDRFEKRTVASVKRVERAFGMMGAALATTGLVAFLKSSANMVSEQRAMAESVGLTTSAFSALNYAARQNSLSQEELGKSLAKLNVVLGNAAIGEDKASASLKKFGITTDMVRSGAVGTDEALRKIADRFAAMPNGIEKTALAAELFGEKVGPRMIQFLNLGSKGLDEFARKGEEVGAVISDKVADAVARANDKLAALYQTIQTQVLVGLSAFFGLVEANEGDKKLEELTKQIADLEQEMRYLAESSKKAEEGGFLAKLIHTGDAARIAEVRNELVALRKERDRLKQEQLDRITAGGVKTPNAPITAPMVVDKAAKKAADEHARALERVRQEVLLLNDAEGEQAKMRALVNELYAAGKIPQDAYLAFLEESNLKLDDLNKTNEEQSIFMEQAARNIQSFTASLVDAALAGENLGDVVVAALRRIAAEMLTASLLQGIGGMFGSFGFADFGGMIAGKASGGPVFGGAPYIVGEEGPELFVPGKSGTIVPNDALGGAGVNIELTVDNRGATGEAAAMFARSVPALVAQIERSIAEGLSRGRYKVATA